MENSNISPAVGVLSSSQLSSAEFQRMLYAWFEETGLVADLRSYLRLLMIKRLRNTAIGKPDRGHATFSLPKQAVCLVVAEHLLREGCHYTLSVFSTEVPAVASHLPFSLFEAHCNTDSDKWRFDQDSVADLLELLGISKNSDESLRVAGLYFRNCGSLLSCLISAKGADKMEVRVEGGGKGEELESYIERVMALMGVPSSVTEEMKKKVQEVVVQEKEKNGLAVERHFGGIIEELKEQLVVKDHQLKDLIDDQVRRKKENKKLKTELKESRKQLSQMVLLEKSTKLKEERMKEELQEIQRVNDSFEKDKEFCRKKHCSDNCQKNNQIVEELQKEVSKFQALDTEKSIEIERLNSKITSLNKDLMNSQMKINFLNSCLHRYNQLNQQSGGELHGSDEETSDNLTEEILREVHSKLSQLERESDELGIRFKKLTMK